MRFLNYIKRRKTLFLDHFQKISVHFMVAETLLLVFCFQERGQGSSGQGAREAVLMERKKVEKDTSERCELDWQQRFSWQQVSLHDQVDWEIWFKGAGSRIKGVSCSPLRLQWLWYGQHIEPEPCLNDGGLSSVVGFLGNSVMKFLMAVRR